MIVRANLLATVVFVVTATVAAAAFTAPTQWVAAVVAMACFVIGIVAFVWSFLVAVQRSRNDQVAVVQLYLLGGGVAPRRVRLIMSALLLIQVVAGLATALARANDTDGSPGTSLALGVLVPTLGFGLNGLWAARHGTFEPRADASGGAASSETRDEVNDSAGPIGQNGDHG
ncbi:MAG: hypothetical protein AB8G26_02960 [Ilumatobacter sp.]